MYAVGTAAFIYASAEIQDVVRLFHPGTLRAAHTCALEVEAGRIHASVGTDPPDDDLLELPTRRPQQNRLLQVKMPNQQLLHAKKLHLLPC